jgi:hypothetical protein
MPPNLHCQRCRIRMLVQQPDAAAGYLSMHKELPQQMLRKSAMYRCNRTLSCTNRRQWRQHTELLKSIHTLTACCPRLPPCQTPAAQPHEPGCQLPPVCLPLHTHALHPQCLMGAQRHALGGTWQQLHQWLLAILRQGEGMQCKLLGQSAILSNE